MIAKYGVDNLQFEYPKLTQANDVATCDVGTQMNIIRTHAAKTTTPMVTTPITTKAITTEQGQYR